VELLYGIPCTPSAETVAPDTISTDLNSSGSKRNIPNSDAAVLSRESERAREGGREGGREGERERERAW
jgi:hypothetical protein